MTTAEKIGVKVSEILLPNDTIDPTKWAVIACDQFTSQPEYWEQVEQIVGDSPSTFRMILPEVYLNSPDLQERINSSQQVMKGYLRDGVLEPHTGFVLVERTTEAGVQNGLMVALDLETYDYNKGSQTLIRATEGTILDRLPPRMQVRRGAELELPHIMVLYDDPEGVVLRETLAAKDSLPLAYDFELMLGSGHLAGHFVQDPALIDSIVEGLASLISSDSYCSKYNLEPGSAPLLFAMGDGNHSLATAKAIWEDLKPTVGMDHPARYALVELVNLHDPSLSFEAIHRVVFNGGRVLEQELLAHFAPGRVITHYNSLADLISAVLEPVAPHQRFGMLTERGYTLVELTQPRQNLPVGNLQEFLDRYLADHPEAEIDYVHGDDVVDTLGSKPGNLGFYLPPITKDSFFKSLVVDGALPRKTFSMGHAEEKRFYMECRLIKPD